jgi:hypothetical protein
MNLVRWSTLHFFLASAAIVSHLLSCGCDADTMVTAEAGGAPSQVDELTADSTATGAEDLVVQDYLETLSNEELEKICLDRGFSLAARGDPDKDEVGQHPELRREDYLAAARRCLTLEDEMNAIIAAHPELAAELDAEIERMKRHKMELERERDEILAQKAMLEEQLEKAGVDVGSCFNRTSTAVPSGASKGGRDLAALNPEDMTVDEVLRHSFTLLYQRVMQDVRMVKKALDPLVLKPLGRGCQTAWKYAKPTLLALWVKARTTANAYLTATSPSNANATDSASAIA